LCTVCLKTFASERWRYASVVSIRAAKTLPVEELLRRTNPGLEECLRLKEQINALGGDACFATAYEQLEGMRAGALRSSLLRQLLDWDRLAAKERTELGQQIGAQARAWQFARQVAPGFPHAGCLTAALAVLGVCLGFLFVPPVRSWLWGAAMVVAAAGLAALTSRALQTQQVRKWTRDVLIPEAQDANVSLACFLAVVEDVSGSRLEMMEDLWPVRVELETVRGVLTAEAKL
jgi:hypothetical protein